MSDHGRRLDKLETLYQRPPGGPTPEEWRALCDYAAHHSHERGLDPDEVIDEMRRMIAAEGWPPRSVTEPEATP